ncbi:MAG: hypothetical protein Q9219_004424 [cf. Caloplaca sp. 3 TL-2023]
MVEIKGQSLFAFDRGHHQRNRRTASSLRDQGKHAQAASLLRQNLAMSSNCFDQQDLTILSDRDTLSDCLSELGDYEEAIKLDEVTLPIRRKVDPEGEDTIATLQSLADNLSQNGEHEKAIPLHRSALATRTRTLGREHPDTSETKHNLASSLYGSGQIAEASRLNAQLLKVRERHLAPGDDDLIATRHNLATNYYALGNLEHAAQLTNQNLKALQTPRGSNDAQLVAVRGLQDRIKSTIRKATKAKSIREKHTQSSTKQEPDYRDGDAKIHVGLGLRDNNTGATDVTAGIVPSSGAGTAQPDLPKLDTNSRDRKANFNVPPPMLEADNRATHYKRWTEMDGKTEPEPKLIKLNRYVSVETQADVTETSKPQTKETTLKDDRKDTKAQQGAAARLIPAHGILKPSRSCPEVHEKILKESQQLHVRDVPFRGRRPSDLESRKDGPGTLHRSSDKADRRSMLETLQSTCQQSEKGRTQQTAMSPMTRTPPLPTTLSPPLPTTLDPPLSHKPRSRSFDSVPEEQTLKQTRTHGFLDTCDAHDGQLFNYSARSQPRWFDRFRTTQSLVARSRKSKGSRVRIAILDTGIDLGHPHFDNPADAPDTVDQQQYGPRRDRVKECRSFVRETAGDHDSVGHGTHCAALLLDLSPNADIFVARVYEEGTHRLDPEAIRHAADQWKVSIITMSFGWPQYQTAVAEAIDYASTRNVLIFAAASNGGANDGVAFPANFLPVICVHSTNEQGKPSNFTPNPLLFGPNFAVLGENVQAAWPGRENGRSQSGTSTATPILAAVVALVLEFVDQKPRKTADEKRLRDHRVMTKVLLAMSDEVEGYHYVKPWKLMNSDTERQRVELRIQDAIGS